MPRASTFVALAELAEEQWGLFTRLQAEATGMAWTTLSRLTRSGSAERVAHGVYRLRGTAADEHIDVHAAWLQLAPSVRAWERTPDQGVVSHRSAAALYGYGHLPADTHQFTFPARRQSRRDDVHLYRAPLAADEWVNHRGLLITRPARIAADLLKEREDPEAVAHVVAEALRAGQDDPVTVATAIAPQAGSFGLERNDGLALMDWLLGLANDPRRGDLINQARRILRRRCRRRG
jgi:predicted transcriptional regulator of viral defense system